MGTHASTGSPQSQSPPEVDTPNSERRGPFLGVLIALTAVGIAVRVVTLVTSQWNVQLGQDDSAYYANQGRLIRDGHWFVDPFAWIYTHGRLVRPSASHPPLFSLATAFADLIGLGSTNGMRLFCCVLGGAGIFLVGLLGREVAGPRVGLIAAAIAALYPLWFLTDDLILSEVLYVPLIAALLLVAYRLWRTPTMGTAALLGLIGGLAALTRSEGLLVLLLVLASFVVLCPDLSVQRRLGMFAVGSAVAVLTLVPWVAYNATRFDDVVALSTNDGATLADANCGATYGGPHLGLFVFGCHEKIDESGDESVQSKALRDLGIQYAKDHASRVPIVVAARLGRVWGVFRPFGTLDADSFGRWSRRTSQVMVVGYWFVALLGIAGLVILRRRRVPISPFVSALVAVSITAAATYGIARFRVPGDVAFVVLAAVSLDALLRRWRDGAPSTETERPAATPEPDVAPQSTSISRVMPLTSG